MKKGRLDVPTVLTINGNDRAYNRCTRKLIILMEVQVKNGIILPTVIVLLGMFASVSHATCLATGEISRVSVNPGAVVSSFYVITSTPQQPSFLYGTTDGKVVNAALVAQASHMTVQV